MVRFNNGVREVSIWTLIFCILTGCTKDPGTGCAEASDTYYTISAEEKAKIPYSANGLDTMLFISNTGDTDILYGQGVQQMDLLLESSGGPPGCKHSTMRYEGIKYAFQGNDLKQFHHLVHLVPSGSMKTPLVDITIAGHTFQNFYASWPAYDTITINNLEYTGYILKGIAPLADSVNYIFYSPIHGVLSIHIDKAWTKQ
jgi:hypothetical protein